MDKLFRLYCGSMCAEWELSSCLERSFSFVAVFSAYFVLSGMTSLGYGSVGVVLL